VTALNFKEETATAVFHTGPIETTMYFVRMPHDTLLALYKSEMKDRPEYKDQDHTESFNREKSNSKDEGARGLLKKVAEAYGNLRSAEFEFEDVHLITDQTTVTRSKLLTHLLISSRGKWRGETSGSGERRIEIADGKTLWTFFPESNQYTAYPAGNKRGPILDRYLSIEKVRGSATIIGSERIGTFDCKVVKIERPDSVRNLWIDAKTNLILKDDSTVTVSPPSDLETINSVTTFSVTRVLPALDDQLFSFDPQKVQAKQRDDLRHQAQTNSIGTPAPDFALFDLENKPVKLSELRGKAVLLDFWATWCAPCRAELPQVELLHRDFKDKGLIVLGVDDEESKDQAAFLGKSGYTFRSLVDPTEQVKNLYSVGGIPTTVLIDRQGTIQVFELGGSSYDLLREAIQKVGIF
jgi:peroxiredoxin/outer membrane lipoprotein-sorting protein